MILVYLQHKFYNILFKIKINYINILRVKPPPPISLVKNSGCSPAPHEEQCHECMQYSETL